MNEPINNNEDDKLNFGNTYFFSKTCKILKIPFIITGTWPHMQNQLRHCILAYQFVTTAVLYAGQVRKCMIYIFDMLLKNIKHQT